MGMISVSAFLSSFTPLVQGRSCHVAGIQGLFGQGTLLPAGYDREYAGEVFSRPSMQWKEDPC
jgi:hypothetical protein